jgi:sulfur-oxidizing protein SoxA
MSAKGRRAVSMLAAGATLAAAVLAANEEPVPHAVEGRRSGYTYLQPQTQAQQNDAFANPGMLWVESGQRLWKAGVAGVPSCAACHGPDAQVMRGVAARYPRYDAALGRVVNLEQRINHCRGRFQRAAPLAYEGEELLALTAYVAGQSRGMPVAVRIDGPAAASFQRGRAEYLRRRGQLDLSCADCHDGQAGARLRGEVISQGQINGHPAYRHLWQSLASTHRMFAWCNEAVRAEPYALGAREYVDLELFLRWRGRGLPVETPAVRR